MIRSLHFSRLIALPIVLLIALNSSIPAQMTKAQIDSMISRLASMPDDTTKVITLMNIGNEIGYTDLDAALRYGKQGYELSQKIGYARGMGRTSYLVGISYADLGQFSLADSFLTVSEERFSSINDQNNLAKISNARGGIQLMQGNYLLAAEYYSKAAAKFDELRDTTSAMIAHQNLIASLGQVKQHERAVELGKRNLQRAQARNDSLQIGYTLQNLVTDLVYLNRLDEASTYISTLEVFAGNYADQNLASEAHSTMGTYYYKRNDFTRAAEHFGRSVAIAQTLNNPYQLAHHYNSLGQAQWKKGDFAAAGQSLREGLRLAKEYENKRAESNAYLSLGKLYDSTGDYRTASGYYISHINMNDSLLGTEARNYTSQLEALYESNKKENEILRLQKIEQEKDFQLKRRNTWLGIGISLIVLLVVIIYLIRRIYRGRQRLAKQEAALLKERIVTVEKEQQISSLQSMINGQETERTRIAKDLHDGLGGLFSTVKMHYSTLQQETPVIKENPLYRKTLDLINNASDELRRVAHNMMPEVLMKVGLVEALKDFCNNISSGKLLKVTLQTFGMDKRLGSATEIMLYRIIQELVNNIIKHAYATEAIIQINREGNRLSLTIEDNGRGFDTREAEEKRSMGMATVRSRVDYLNGKITIDSRKDIGTTVMIDLLLNEN